MRRWLMEATAERTFQEWLAAPITYECPDRRLEVRRASEADFEAVYDLVDEGFGAQRPRPWYEWLYRRNPRGTARCWLITDRATGRIVSADARWPWPMARGAEEIPGALSGDLAVASEWQRRGLYAMWLDLWHRQPSSGVAVWWPNEKSRGASKKHGGQGGRLRPVPRAVMVLGTTDVLRRRGWTSPLATAAGAPVDAAQGLWRRLVLRPDAGVAVEEVRRFDPACGELARRWTEWPGFWCPRDAEFLDWRYLRHPTATYVALASADPGRLQGYCVLKIDAEMALLMEFVAPPSPSGIRAALLRRAIEIARAAGCAQLEVYAPPRWPHWGFVRAAGFLPVRSSLFFGASKSFAKGAAADLRNWRCSAGDVDCL